MVDPHRGLAASLVVIALTTGCRSFDEPPPGWEGEYSAEAALTRAVEKSGGEGDPLQEATDLMASITMERPDRKIPLAYVVLWKKPDKWSIELSGTGKDRIKFVGDGRRRVEIKNGSVVRDDVKMGEVGVDRLLRYLFLLRFFRDGAGSEAEIVENVPRADGGHNVRIEKIDVHGRKWVLSLDAESLKPMALREWAELEDGRYGPLDTYFSEWVQDAKGNRVPRVLLTYSSGKLLQTMRIRDLQWNRGLRDVDFQVPN